MAWHPSLKKPIKKPRTNKVRGFACRSDWPQRPGNPGQCNLLGSSTGSSSCCCVSGGLGSVASVSGSTGHYVACRLGSVAGSGSSITSRCSSIASRCSGVTSSIGGISSSVGSFGGVSSGTSSGVGCSSRRFDGCGCRSGCWLFFFTASSKGSSSHQSGQDEGLVHFRFPW